MTLLERNVVLDCEPLAFTLGETCAFGSHSKARIYTDFLSIFGVDVGKFLYCFDGISKVDEVTTPTGAAIVAELNLAGPQQKAMLEIAFGVSLSTKVIDKLQCRYSEVKRQAVAEDEYYLIKMGQTNPNQEMKEDKKWGVLADISGFVLRPIKNENVLMRIDNFGRLGGATADAELFKITFTGLMLDKAKYTNLSIPVGHSLSTDKAEYALLSIDEAAAAATGE